MSVVLLDPELYKEVYNKACQCSDGGKSEMGILDCFSRKTERQIRELIMNLYEMNEASYSARYKEELDTERIRQVKSMMSGWRYDDIKTKPCNIYQLLKWLECIEFQIEEPTMKTAGLWRQGYEESMHELKDAIDCVASAIISNIPEYKEAKWWSV